MPTIAGDTAWSVNRVFVNKLFFFFIVHAKNIN